MLHSRARERKRFARDRLQSQFSSLCYHSKNEDNHSSLDHVILYPCLRIDLMKISAIDASKSRIVCKWLTDSNSIVSINTARVCSFDTKTARISSCAYLNRRQSASGCEALPHRKFCCQALRGFDLLSVCMCNQHSPEVLKVRSVARLLSSSRRMERRDIRLSA